MLQVDVLQSSQYFINRFQVYLVPYQLLGAFFIFYVTVKDNSLPPAIGVIIQAIFGVAFGYYFGKIQNKFMHAKDERMGGVDESLLQIKQIKFNCYETYFEKRIEKLRAKELKFLKQQVLLLIFIQFMQNILSFATWECTFYFADFITFAITTVIMQNSSQLMYLLQAFPNQLKNYYASINSIIRITSFLKENQIQPWSNDEDKVHDIKIDGTFDWKYIDENQYLKQNQQFDLKLNVVKGYYIVIVGNSASGKSTILKSILNETNCVSGQIVINGEISLATQEPWILSDTIKNNIIYMNKFDELRYKKVMHVTALEQDINQFVNKDFTQLSEKGDNLSGGQQKRINLARAVYKEADIYLFDDPLSALDIKVKCHIYQECFLKFLHGKTRILFTNQLTNLSGVDQIYLLQNDKLVPYNTQIKIEEEKLNLIDIQFENNHLEDKEPKSKASFTLMSEDQRVGKIDNKVIKTIFQFQGGFWAIIAVVTYFSVLMVLSTLSSKTLSNPQLDPDEFREVALKSFPLFNIPIYIAIISITGYFLLIGIKTSSVVHKNIFASLMKASFTQFYNQILIGRLMNRLSKDIYNIDMLFPNQIYNLSIQFTNLIMPLITSLIFLNYIAYPIVLIFVIILLLFTISYYKCLTEMTRIESVSKSPVFTYYQQIIRGLLFVRSCLPKRLVLQNHYNNIDLDLGNQMYLAGLQQWFSQTSSIITNIFQTILFVVCLLYPNNNPAMTYLIVIQMSNVSQLLVQVAVSYGNLLMYSISFERCLHLSNDIEYDDYAQGSINSKSIGSITLTNASFQYPNNQKDVLSNLSLTIESGQKIGILGRTGAGKSSIIMALMRMIHLTNGDVKIDETDLNEYALQELRKKFSVIPQESLIYKGTLKENLDPYGLADDQNLEEVCQACQLYNMKSFQDYKLETKIQQSGGNLSLGEKQLITIARCMIENRKIILVDEATANIDNPTEELIKNIFKVHFLNQTMITIAHKVSTIMESDKIVVLSAGQIIECDSPNNLLKQPKSEFKQIVDLINKNL
ncbi:unnamed protein product (macronuclear) [Paramecium tetraurelia]|uniref:ABC transporter family protein n=1 Tax=Paramecium tetraurelia TaxID=5888 RepID=A0BTC0_PARTE|nr:uncharacterized protein GSPATT00032019001 [Paramecium tetraurelia]CAK61787.1 unnamed protein product [Paramecium tetraurelia]|eukprot:XP_001429185.1 hypothetical protein (macronuclear) [Paramecium tetraurelia strain d4-2]